MKLREFTQLIDLAVAKYKLREDNTQLKFDSSCIVEGTTSYIPARYSAGTYDDPPEAFAKEYDFEREVEAVADGYKIGKSGNKCIMAVGMFEEGPEGDDYAGGEDWDGNIEEMKAAVEKLGLTGDEDVFVHYDGKDYPLELLKRQNAGVDGLVCAVEKDKYGSYDIIWLAAPFEPSDAWKKWKAKQIAEDIDPEEELDYARNDYYADQADARYHGDFD